MGAFSQADIDVTFYIPSLDKAEEFNPSWEDAQDLCANKGSKVEGGVGPFGLLTLASKNLEEYTALFFRVFKTSTKHIVLLCSDARRSVLSFSIKTNNYSTHFSSNSINFFAVPRWKKEYINHHLLASLMLTWLITSSLLGAWYTYMHTYIQGA